MATMARIVGPHRRLVVTGGWCASAAVLAAKRRLFGPLIVADVAETGTLGAATLAARAAGYARSRRRARLTTDDTAFPGPNPGTSAQPTGGTRSSGGGGPGGVPSPNGRPPSSSRPCGVSQPARSGPAGTIPRRVDLAGARRSSAA